MILEKSSKAYLEDLLDDLATRPDGHWLLEHRGFDPKEVNNVWSDFNNKISITAADGVSEAIALGNYVINVTEDVESEADCRIAIRPYDNDIESALDAIADEIWSKVQDGRSVTVHCALGMERSGLAVAWYLKKHRSLSLNQAYGFIQAFRPIVVDRRSYLNV